MEDSKPKFILTTKALFTYSFRIFLVMSFFFLLSMFDFLLNMLYVTAMFSDVVTLFDLATVVFFISVGFYTLMPLIRFIVNFRKIETEEEKKSVSGFWVRYFSGFIVSLLLVIFVPSSFMNMDFFFIVGILGLSIFYIVSIRSLEDRPSEPLSQKPQIN
jgi:hypothetical protein